MGVGVGLRGREGKRKADARGEGHWRRLAAWDVEFGVDTGMGETSEDSSRIIQHL